MPRVWFSFWDGLFGSSFALPLFCWPFMVSFVYVLYTLFFGQYIALHRSKKKIFHFGNSGADDALFSKKKSVVVLWVVI